jgi:hypothetical protein
MKTTYYRGYKIKSHAAKERYAYIYRPKAGLMMKGSRITLPLQEGEAALLQQARERIDAEESLKSGVGKG